MTGHFKDTIIAELSPKVNVAQFVSYSPDLKQRHSCVTGYALDHSFESLGQVIKVLFSICQDNSLNIRSFDPYDPKSRPFAKTLKTVEEVKEKAIEFTSMGLHIIIHEEIEDDINTSGVLVGDIIEFAPLTTPRCVEPAEVKKHGLPASLPKEVGIALLERVHGFKIDLDFPKEYRIEFSVFAKPYGHKQEHVMVWELEDIGQTNAAPLWSWPNRFSRFIGDKTYGLLIADILGFKVPHTDVVGKNVFFNFGQKTGSSVIWTRTAPIDQTPGKFPTTRGYSDPFSMMAQNDPDGLKIAAVLLQDEVPFSYSGALFKNSDSLHIEGVVGRGDEFMTGEKPPEDLPQDLKEKITEIYSKAESILGPVRMEWVYDGSDVWVVQMHKGDITPTKPDVIVDGNPPRYEQYIITDDLEEFRKKVRYAKEQGIGLEVIGNFGITSHIGDILRKAQVPSKILRPS